MIVLTLPKVWNHLVVVFWFVTISMYGASQETRTCIEIRTQKNLDMPKMQGKVIPSSTHVKMFHEV